MTDAETAAPAGVARWRIKPFGVEAITWTGENEGAVEAFVGEVNASAPGHLKNWNEPGFFVIRSTVDDKFAAELWSARDREWVPVPVGHVIVKGPYGIFPLPPDAFAGGYESADAPDDTTPVTRGELAAAALAADRARETVAMLGEDLIRQRKRAERAEAEAERLRTELEHAKSALAGDNEGIRLWMLDCGNLVDKHRERADAAEAALTELRPVRDAETAQLIAAERARVLEVAERLKVTLTRPGNGPAQREETEMVPLPLLRAALAAAEAPPERVTADTGGPAESGAGDEAPADVATLADAAVKTAGYALAFGRIDRTVCRHPDGQPESDSDHTVALAWIAPALAALEPGLDPLLVAAFAVVHDAVEVFAGDTPTLRITGEERAAKAEREEAAVFRWDDEIGGTLPWLPSMIARYEMQAEPEARFVRAADKICPKYLHIINGCRDLAGYGMDAAELAGVLARQRADIGGYAGEFTGLLALYDEMARRVLAMLGEATGSAA